LNLPKNGTRYKRFSGREIVAGATFLCDRHKCWMRRKIGGAHRAKGTGLEAAQTEQYDFMSSSSHLLANESVPRRVRKPKTRRKTRVGKKSTSGAQSGEPEMAAPGSLTRTKALLLAALRVWELKHRIRD
jgi:hypothetical protein